MFSLFLSVGINWTKSNIYALHAKLQSRHIKYLSITIFTLVLRYLIDETRSLLKLHYHRQLNIILNKKASIQYKLIWHKLLCKITINQDKLSNLSVSCLSKIIILNRQFTSNSYSKHFKIQSHSLSHINVHTYKYKCIKVHCALI